MTTKFRYLLREHTPPQYSLRTRWTKVCEWQKELKPDIIFLDFYMPGLTGMEVLKDLRSTDDFASIPVVFHSTKSLDEAELKFFHGKTRSLIFPKQSLTLPDSASRIRELMITLARHAARNR